MREVATQRAEQTDLLDDVESYRLTFERSPLPMWVYDRETFAFLAVNQAAIRQYGFTREELMRMTLRDLRDPGDLQNL